MRGDTYVSDFGEVIECGKRISSPEAQPWGCPPKGWSEELYHHRIKIYLSIFQL